MSRVLILDANARQSLVAIRQLGRHGVSVTAGSTARLAAGALSRYTDRHIRYERPRTETDAFIDTIERELRSRPYDMLLPITDATVIPIVKHKQRLEEHAAVPFLPYHRLLRGLDKKRTIDAARRAGIPHPRTMSPSSLDAEHVASELGFPVIVKPRQASQRLGVTRCDSPEALRETFEKTQFDYGPLLLQEYIPNGGERGVYTLFDDSSSLKAVTVQRRLRTNPPEGGPSTLRETVDDPELVSLAERLLRSLEWQGVAMVEFRIDPRDGTPKLLEINPRLWGSLALSVFAGVNFPVKLYECAVNGNLEQTLEYDVGVRSRWLFGDTLQLVARDDAIDALREFLQPSRVPCRYDILDRTDPLPTLGYLANGLTGLVR